MKHFDRTAYDVLLKEWGYGELKYRVEIEVVEGAKSTCHKVGEIFSYPEDRGIICPWLLDSMNGLIRIMEFGGQPPWTYAGTPYEKVMDEDGISTEYIRCPDPTDAGIVVKITRREI